jgi:hypothetical protein
VNLSGFKQRARLTKTAPSTINLFMLKRINK